MAYMPLQKLRNGNEAMRLMDIFKCSPRESSLLFMVALNYHRFPEECRHILARLEFLFEGIDHLERDYGHLTAYFRFAAQGEYDKIRDILKELEELIELPEPLRYVARVA